MIHRSIRWAGGSNLYGTPSAATERGESKFRIYFPSQARPSVKIFTSLPPFSGFTKIVSAASPRFRLRIEDAGVIRSLPSLVQPWAFEIRGQFGTDRLFTLDLLLKRTCSTAALYSTSVASFVSARALTLSWSFAGGCVSVYHILTCRRGGGIPWFASCPVTLFRRIESGT